MKLKGGNDFHPGNPSTFGRQGNVVANLHPQLNILHAESNGINFGQEKEDPLAFLVSDKTVPFIRTVIYDLSYWVAHPQVPESCDKK